MLSRFISRIFKQEVRPLGRWQVNDKNALLRASYANMDSCGDSLCGTPAKYNEVAKNFEKTKKIKK